MASDYFLKLKGIAGESLDAKHKDEIELVSFSWGVAAQADAGPGGGTGKVQLTDVEVVKRASKASPQLFLACASGQHIPEAMLTVRKAGKDQMEYLKYKFTDILVSGYHESAGADQDAPLDLVRFNFAKIEISYAAQKPDGSLAPPVKAGWDLKQNKKI